MFSTLRRNNVSDGPYFVQPTSPPFDTKRQGKLARLACVNCRTSKLKCTGEPTGCRRCKAKNSECCYPVTRNGRRGSRPSSRVPLPGEAGSQPNERPRRDRMPDSSPEMPAYNFQDLCSPQFDLAGDPPSQEMPAGDVGDLPSQRAFHEYCHGVLPSDPLGCHQQKENQEPVGSWQSADTTLASPIFDVFANSGSLVGSDTIGSAPQSLTETAFESDGICFCFADAIGTYEYIQTALVWKLHERTATADTLLQDQKRAMAKCEFLLRCKSCRSQSKYVTLLTTMCEKIVSSMETICQSRPSCFRRSSKDDTEIRKGAEEDGANRNWYQESLPSDTIYSPQWRPAQENRDLVKTTVGDVSGRRISDHRDEETNHSVMIGKWQLDDDDELDVFRGLVSARATRLFDLVATLEGVVNEHRWSAQRPHLCDIRERCSSLSERLTGSRLLGPSP